MSGCAGLTQTPHAATTYAQLTERAGRSIAHAHAVQAARSWRAGRNPCWEPVDLDALPDLDPRSALDAHRDLAAALAQLGRALARPPAGTAARGSTRRRGGTEGRLLRCLEVVAAPRDWETPMPATGPHGALADASVRIRAAADLWATHHTADGHPRSPEAARMRHPSTLGAASRQWRLLVRLLAGAIRSHPDVAAGLTAPESEAVDTISRITGTAMPSEASLKLLELTVARPVPRRGQPALDALGDRVDRLHRLAWALAESGSSPAVVHSNIATIGIALHRAAATAHRHEAHRARHSGARGRHLDAAARAESAGSAWRIVAEQLRDLRTPHPGSHPIQIERLEIDRLLARVATDAGEGTRPEIAWTLGRLAASFAEIADLNRRALRDGYERGDLLLRGRAIPTEALSRRPDLLQARLTDQVVPAPTAVLTQLECAYRAAAGGVPITQAPDISPPAA